MSGPISENFQKFRGQWIEHALRDHDLSDGAFRVLACLAHHFLNRERRTCWPAQDTIAEAAGMKVRTVQKHLSELVERGHLTVRRQGRDKPNLYIPAFHDAQIRAGHEVDEAQEFADHGRSKTRKFASHDPQNSVSKTRMNLRTNPLKEPSEEHLEGDPASGAGIAGSIVIDSSNAREASATIEPAPASAPQGRATGASDASVDDDDWFENREFEELGDDESVEDFLRDGVPDLPIRASAAGWRKMLAWVGENCGPSAMRDAVAHRRAGTLTIEMIEALRRKNSNVA